jgi:cob(I)alamin adenosyltransferase
MADGSRLPKDHARFVCMGDVDELNSHLGLLRARLSPLSQHLPALGEIDSMVYEIQHDLFDLGGELALPDHAVLASDRLLRLDDWITTLNADLPALKEFILPSGSEATSLAHVARTVARRAERSLVALDHAQDRSELPRPRALLRQYLNRLSDLLFVIARSVSRAQGLADVFWRNDARQRAS